jgi:ribonuclease VapC
MIVDASAIIALIRNEPDAENLYRTIVGSPRALMVAPTYVECCLVLTKDRSEEAIKQFDALLEKLSVDIIPFTPKMAKIAAHAFLKFGKGRGNQAQLNFGDCISYAASKVEAMPLLFKGEDFGFTDVERVVS